MDIAEKRVYDASAGRTRLAVATGQGLAIVGISADVIGEFGLALREPVRDVAAAGDGRLLAATQDDLQIVVLGDDGVAETVARVATGAGPTDAVAIAGAAAGNGAPTVVAAGSDGVVRRAARSTVLDAAAESDAAAADWTSLGEATVRNADGRLLAAADGVYRTDEDAIKNVGLDDVRDVAVPDAAAAIGPLAATAGGLYRLGPGWTVERSGAFDVVAADRGESADRLAAHAGAGEQLLQQVGGEWSAVAWPADAAVADVAYAGDAVYAVATDGTVLADAGEGWRTRSIGLPDVVGCAVVR